MPTVLLYLLLLGKDILLNHFPKIKKTLQCVERLCSQIYGHLGNPITMDAIPTAEEVVFEQKIKKGQIIVVKGSNNDNNKNQESLSMKANEIITQNIGEEEEKVVKQVENNPEEASQRVIIMKQKIIKNIFSEKIKINKKVKDCQKVYDISCRTMQEIELFTHDQEIPSSKRFEIDRLFPNGYIFNAVQKIQKAYNIPSFENQTSFIQEIKVSI